MPDDAVTAEPKKRGRPPKSTPMPGDPNFKATHKGNQPHFPVYGDSWEDKAGVVKWWHGNGFYLEPPGKSAGERAEELGKAAVAEMEGTGASAIKAMKGSAAAADAADPDAERVEPEKVVGEIVVADPLGANAGLVSGESEQASPVEAEAIENTAAEVERSGDESDEELPAVAKIEELAADFEISELRYIVADSRDLVLAMIKEMPKLWGALPEAKQYDLARGIENGISEMVQRIAEAVASREAQPIRAFLESYNEKDGIKAVLKLKPASEAEELQAVIGLHKAKGRMVLVTPADADDYRAERKAKTDPDEPGLELDPDPPEHPDDDSDLAGEGDDTDYGAGDDG